MWAFVWGVVVLSGGAFTNTPADAQEKEAAGGAYRPAKPSDDQLAMGEKVYFKKCVWCHGPEGAGDGPSADRLWPRPRNFNQGTFKIRTTASGELPTDEDLFETVTNGLPGSAMPAWDGILTEEQRRAVVAFVKTKLIKDRDFQDTEFEEFHLLKFEGQVPSSTESIERGREVFNTTGKCVQCHGNEGRGNGNLTQKDDWGFPIFPANLQQCWNFRGNRRDPYNPANVFREVSTGLNGTPMPSFADVLSVEERWNVANFVISLCPKVKIDQLITMKPVINFVVGSRYTEEALPTTIDDPKWNEQALHFVGLGGQITRKPQNFNRRADGLWVKSFYNNEEIAFFLEWDDRTESRAEGDKLPPPFNVADLTVPVAYYASKHVFNEVMPGLYPNWKSLPQPVTYNDAVAIQFPAKWESFYGTPERPFFIHGDDKKPVDLWKWESSGAVVAYTGHGIDGKTGEDKIAARQAALKAEGAQFKDGVWRVILKRSLKTDDKDHDVQFEVNKYIPIAFQAWDGDNGEAGAKMALSAWYYVVLQPLTPTKAYVYPFVAIILVVGVQWWVIRKATNMQNGHGGRTGGKKK
jgi:mono/diheme cytochrome c family protein